MKTRRRRSRSFSRKNPVRRRRRRSFARRNPARRASLKHVMVFPNGRRRRRSRRGFAARNPVRRRSFSRRNPAGDFSSTIFDRDTMMLGAGVVVGTVGTNMLLNALLLPNAQTGAVPFQLPGVNTAQAGYMNSVPVALYKFAIGASVGYLLRNSSPKLGQGIVVGAFAGAISTVLQSTNLLATLPGGGGTAAPNTSTAGVGRYFGSRRGAGSYTPGVNPIFTGPASGFLGNGSPMGSGRLGMRRPGMGALFNRHTARRATSMIPDPFLG